MLCRVIQKGQSDILNCTYMHSTVTTRIITIPDDQYAAQTASIGTPVSAALNDRSFVQIAPLGLVLPEDDGQVITDGEEEVTDGGQVLPGSRTSGAETFTVFVSFSSLVLLIMVGTFVLMI